MYGRLIALDKQTGIRPVIVGGTWIRLFAKCVLRATGSEATSACQYDQIYAGLKVGIGGTVHRVKDIWDTKLITEDWGFLLVDAKTCSTRSIESEFCGQFNIYGHLELILF